MPEAESGKTLPKKSKLQLGWTRFASLITWRSITAHHFSVPERPHTGAHRWRTSEEAEREEADHDNVAAHDCDSYEKGLGAGIPE